MEVAPQKHAGDREMAYLNFADTSRKGYLFLPETAMTASSFLRTMRSQNTTHSEPVERVRAQSIIGNEKEEKKQKFLRHHLERAA
jgi:hypothetical protein